jgi:Glycosyl transferase family 11
MSSRTRRGEYPMITVSVLGGLGNQMFQYAAGKALAERHGVNLAIELGAFYSNKHTPRPFLLDRLCLPEVEGWANGADNLVRASWTGRVGRLLRRRGLPKTGQLQYYYEPHFHYDPEFEALGPCATLVGYFQSERYFSEIADNLRDWFSPREPLSGAAAGMLARIEESPLPVSVHVRRGDYLDHGRVKVHGIVGESYYRAALLLLESAIGADAKLFVFSDDPEGAEEVLNFVPKSRLFHVCGDPQRPWEDMELMAHCRHHIIANSSFSWWGAWLNSAPEKVVVAPRNWFAPGKMNKLTSDLYPPAWLLA